MTARDFTPEELAFLIRTLENKLRSARSTVNGGYGCGDYAVRQYEVKDCESALAKLREA